MNGSKRVGLAQGNGTQYTSSFVVVVADIDGQYLLWLMARAGNMLTWRHAYVLALYASSYVSNSTGSLFGTSRDP